jgi:zeta-carotene desaturase
MKRCLIIGGGLAGLTSAIYLSEKKNHVTLIESSPKLGGRTYSIIHPIFKTEFDNGQHILMGCYDETIELLKKINALDLIYIQDSLVINFFTREKKNYSLKAAKKFYPLNLLASILSYRAISLKSRLKIIDLFLDLCCCFTCDLSNLTVKEWFLEKKQTSEAIKNFWDILIVGTLNTTAEKASAEIFGEVLKRIFFSGNKGAKIIFPNVGLSSLFVRNSENFLKELGGSIKLSESVISFGIEHDKIVKVITDKSVYEGFDFVISSIPSKNLIAVLEKSGIEDYFLPEFEYSTILNVHLWLKENPFKEKFYGFLDSSIHWVFNHGDHISITISAADYYSKETKEKILEMICSELEIFFPIFDSKLIIDAKVIKEKRATFIPSTVSMAQRKNIHVQIKNLILAGDWTDTNLPSTIESAVLSGRLAANNVMNSF